MSEARRELISLIRAHYPLVYIVSFEEQRVEREIRAVASELGRRLWTWSITRGFVDAATGQAVENTIDPLSALEAAASAAAAGTHLFVLKDFHALLEAGSHVSIRKLRDAVYDSLDTDSSFLILSPVLKLPQELEKDVTVLDYPLPSKQELDHLLTEFEDTHSERATIRLDPPAREAFIKALQGLTQIEAENALGRALIQNSRLDENDLPLVIKEKEQLVRKSGILEYVPLEAGLDQVGGLNELKAWLRTKRSALSEGALKYGVKTPRGVMLIGVPGCGKSLTAKAVAAEWKLPLLRFDLGKVFGMYVGQSEGNIRRALRTAESLAPCVLWIDEIEKGFAGATAGELDSGTSARVFGAFITWLQEKTHPVYVVATANHVEALPPELLRKGRFDDIFFVDLPKWDERREVFESHIRRRSRVPEDFDLDLLAKATEGFTGADIEASIDAVLERAYADDAREPSLSDFLHVIEHALPLSATIRDQIEALRSHARTRARPASSGGEEVPIPDEDAYRERWEQGS